MPLIKAKAKLEKGKLKAKVKYPLVGGAELELGSTNKLKALVKVPFLFSAKLFGFFKLKRGKEENEKEKR